MKYTVRVETWAVTFGIPPVQRISVTYEKFRWRWAARFYIWLVNHTPMPPGCGAWQHADDGSDLV